MYHELVHLLQGLKPPYILLIQACIIVAFPYFLWRTLKLEKWFPLGVVQIFSGVLLGPSIFGAIDAAFLNWAPAAFDPQAAVNACTNPQPRELFNAIFGTTCSKGAIVNRAAGIASIATIAVCLFGFLAGADADKELIRKSGKSVVSIGVFGMLFGWGLAIVAGYFIYQFFPVARGPRADAFNFSVAYGLVIAVSALPVLALILRGLDITRSRMGAVALASASIADTMMWFGLGLVVALALGGDLGSALLKAFLGGALSVGFIMFVASPILNRMMAKEAPESAVITFTALSIFVAAAITGITELHPVLGAFVAGFFLPDRVRELAAHRLDQTTIFVLMPFFFLNTGLNTVFSVFDPNVWILFLISILLCVFGKMIGHGVAARMTGESWPFALSIGILLQTKGLMGLIVIVVFLEKEVVSPLMFSAAVFMCMVSTGLTSILMRTVFNRFGRDLKDEGSTPLAGVQQEEVAVHAGPSPVKAGSAPAIAVLEFNDDLGKFDIRAPSVVIGRHSEDDIRINDIRVSRRHAKLTLNADGKFELHNQTADRADANPILINGEEREHAVLADGDTIILGGAPAFKIRYGAKP